jgi:tripartite-type tricarboxylate transporter receptor subunit TctC
MINKTRRQILLAAGSGLAGGVIRPALAAEHYPSRPIQIVVPFAPGGSGDEASRLIQQRAGEMLGQPLIIVNRPGAGTNIGMQLVARANPDGYTLLMAATGMTVNTALFDNMTFNPMTDLAPVSNVFNSPVLLAINPNVPAKNLTELLAYLRANPEKVNYGSSGIGTSSHLGGELFKQITGTKIQHIPYSGGGASITGVAGNSGVQLVFSNVVTLSGAVRGGLLRAIGVASAKRLAGMPEVPTFLEQGVDFQFGGWYGLCAPAKTPTPIINQLSKTVQAIMQRPEIRKIAYGAGGEPIGDTPEHFRAFLEEDATRLQAMIRKNGIKG